MSVIRRLLTAAALVLALLCAVQPLLPRERPAVLTLNPTVKGPALPEKAGGAHDINRMGEQELLSLPGIGPHIAGLIMEKREQQPFFYLEDLRLIPGIGERRLRQLLPYLRVE